MLDSLGIPPGSDFIFQVVPHGDGTFDVMDTRTKAIVSNHATQPLAAAAAIAQNDIIG